MSAKKRREQVRKVNIDNQRNAMANKIKRQNSLRASINTRLHVIKDEEGALALDAPDIEKLFQRSSFEALVDTLAESGVLDRVDYNNKRYESMLIGLRKRAQSKEPVEESTEAIAS